MNRVETMLCTILGCHENNLSLLTDMEYDVNKAIHEAMSWDDLALYNVFMICVRDVFRRVSEMINIQDMNFDDYININFYFYNENSSLEWMDGGEEHIIKDTAVARNLDHIHPDDREQIVHVLNSAVHFINRQLAMNLEPLKRVVMI